MFYNFFLYFSISTKMSKNLPAKYYQENKERLQKSSWKNFLKKKKNPREYGRECYKNIFVEEKQKLPGYRRKYYRMKKKAIFNCKRVFQSRKFWFFIRKSIKYFSSWKVTSWNLRNSVTWNIRVFFEVFFSKKFGAFLRKYKKLFSKQAFKGKFWWLRPESAGSFWEYIKKSFLLKKHKKFFNLRVRKFYFLKYKDVVFGVLEWIYYGF